MYIHNWRCLPVYIYKQFFISRTACCPQKFQIQARMEFVNIDYSNPKCSRINEDVAQVCLGGKRTLQVFDELRWSPKGQKKTEKRGDPNLKGKTLQLLARIKLATFRLRSECTTTMLRKRVMLIYGIFYITAKTLPVPWRQLEHVDQQKKMNYDATPFSHHLQK